MIATAEIKPVSKVAKNSIPSYGIIRSTNLPSKEVSPMAVRTGFSPVLTSD